jgi:hypothetical protein
MEQVYPWRKTGAVANIVPLTFGREASIEYEPCWLAQFSPHRTGLYAFSCLFIKECLLSCQVLIVLKYSRDRAMWPGPCCLVLCVYQLMETEGGGCWYGYVNMYHTVYLCARVLVVSSVYTSVP